jgi:hypothetical protein
MRNMQNTISAVPNNEIKEGIEEVLRVLPAELTGVIPESVWLNLSVEQKKEILRQHNLLEKYSTEEKIVPAAQEAESAKEVETSVPDVVVEEATRPEEIRSPEFAQALEQAREVESQAQKEFSIEDKTRVEEETAVNASSAKSSWGAKVFGYSVSDGAVNNSEQVSTVGSTDDGRTWAATLIRKILAALGQ